MIVQYVDDCGISAPTQKRIDLFVNDLRKLDVELTQEGSLEEFLGIKFKYNDDGSIECTQKGLIKKNAQRWKVLGDGDLSKALTIEAHRASARARAKIESASGSIKEVE